MNYLFEATMSTILAIVAGVVVCITTLNNVTDDCRTFGKFKVSDTVYECRKLEPAP